MNFLKKEMFHLPVWAWGLGGLAFLVGLAIFLRRSAGASGGTGTIAQGSSAGVPVPYPVGSSSSVGSVVSTPSQQAASNFNIRLPGAQGAQLSQAGPDQSGGYTVTAINVTPELGMMWGSIAPRANPTEVYNFIQQVYSTYGLGNPPSRGTFVAYGVGNTLQRFPFWSSVVGPPSPTAPTMQGSPVTMSGPIYTSSQAFGNAVGATTY